MTVVEPAVPYAWPYDGILEPARIALVVAGAQDAWVARSRRAADVAATVLGVANAMREAGSLIVAVRHTLPAGGRPVALPPPVGDIGWRLSFPAPLFDVVVDAGGVDGFHGSVLDGVLRRRGIDRLVLVGFGHEAAVDSTLRSANDRGYECLLLADAVAPLDDDLSAHALDSVAMSGGIFGAVATSTALLSAIRAPVEAIP
ncbi:MAG TPA: isochorismatase family cysteine hydrolase [Acidimicrobiales bacterium]|nr:isochorismatase family cysteine hydrolase [Acidimicrobiales bacterium]